MKAKKTLPILALTSAFLLASCDGNSVAGNPYGKAKEKNFFAKDDVKPVVSSVCLNAGDYAEKLSDGIYIISLKSYKQNLLVIKDKEKYWLSGRGYGYFAMDNIDKSFIPNRLSDRENSDISVWTISKGHFVKDLKDGINKIEIPGELLNGRDLSILIIKDKEKADFSRKGYGYMGLTVLPSDESVNPTSVTSLGM